MTEEDNNDNSEISDEITINSNKEEPVDDNLPEEDPYIKLKSLEQMLEEKNSSYNDLYERYLRIAADFDNYKKRVTKEKTDLVTYGNEELIKALLNVIDNLERALEHKEADSKSASLIEGVDLVYKQFMSCLEKFGLSRIEAEKGAKFDPNYHQAVEHIQTDEITSGLIVYEMVRGYLLKERLIRPSMVAVSKSVKGILIKDKSADSDNKTSNNNTEDTQTIDIMNDEKELKTEETPEELELDLNIDDDKAKTDDILDLVDEDKEDKSS